jgi:hypothetical protein
MFTNKSRFLIAAFIVAAAVICGASYVLAESMMLSGAKAETKSAKPSEPPENNGFSFAPHKALYEINLVSSHSGSQIVDISGQMFFKWEATCEAWITDHRFKLIYEYTDSPAMRITSDFSTFEPFDRSSFDFTSRRKRDGELYQEIRGRAVMDEDGSGKALFTMPEGLEYELDKGTLFPMSHTIELVEAIRQGKKFHNATIFDGSDEDGPVLINTFIGKETSAMARISPSSSIDLTLINTPAHELRMAFFPLNKPDEAADYEMNVVFHENGVISDMVIDYDDFTVSQKLVALEKLENQPCQ